MICGCLCLSQARVRIEVMAHPELRMPQMGLFIAGSFNQWNPGNPAYALQRTDSGTWYIDLPDTLRYFSYKFTQGSWTVVEGDSLGNSRPDRVYDAGAEPDPRHVRVRILNWESRTIYRFVVTRIPAYTPHDATLYIAGNFNNWRSDDPNYRLQRQVDGTYRVTVFTDVEELQFKFTRGSWQAVEGRGSGRMRSNRVIRRGDPVNTDGILIEIESWEDFTGAFDFFSLYDLLLLFSVFQGLLLILNIPTIQDYNRLANRWLVLLLAITSVMMLLRILGYYRQVATLYPHVQLIPDFLWVLYGPIFYLYVENLLWRNTRLHPRWWLGALPAVAQTVMYLPLFLTPSSELNNRIVSHDPWLEAVFIASGLIGFVTNTLFWLSLQQALRQYQRQSTDRFSHEESLNYLRTVMLIKAVCIVLWVFTASLYLAGRLGVQGALDLSHRTVEVIWLIFSTIPHFLGYFAIHQPEVFKLPRPVPEALPERRISQPDALPPGPEQAPVPEPGPEPERRNAELPDETFARVKQALDAYMERQKPYTNPRLTLNELAEKLHVQPYVLSRVINEGYGVNFFDFINSFRVEEFKLRLEDPRYRNYTLLSLALEVGFNSKTAFNRAFKKITSYSPSEYFSNIGAD
jgi:AraC-like DNA-binding protein